MSRRARRAPCVGKGYKGTSSVLEPPLSGSSAMTELLEELEVKRERENAEAERHRRRRDELNDKTREWVNRRDELNAQVRELVEQAMGHRQRRDELNGEVKKAKEERDVWNRKVNELIDVTNELKRRKLPRGTIPLSHLKRELKDLEFKQMTSVLKPEKEQELMKETGAPRREGDGGGRPPESGPARGGGAEGARHDDPAL